jgi:two-component system response regulator AtoC
MDYLLSCDSIRIVAATDRRDWTKRAKHPIEADIQSAAATHTPVLITAAKPRAKAIAAQIHGRSRHRGADLVVVDCSLPAHRYEEQMFETDVSDGGTLLLLEVVHLPPAMQIRLRARMTVEARARAMGARATLLGTRRIIATSSGDLYDAVEQGSFDRDLFYRLNAIHIVTM